MNEDLDLPYDRAEQHIKLAFAAINELPARGEGDAQLLADAQRNLNAALMDLRAWRDWE